MILWDIMDSIPKYEHSQISNRKGKMAGTYTIKIEYACGHTTEYNSDVQRPVQKIDADCPACRKKQQKEAEQKKEESQLNKEQLTRSAPKLKGSVKQIEFAEKNRNRFIAYWSNPEKGATYKQVPVIKNIIKNEKKAGWWLDNSKVICTQEFIESYNSPKPENTYENDISIPVTQDKTKDISRYTLKPAKLNDTGNCIYIQLLNSDTLSAILLQPADEVLKAVFMKNNFTKQSTGYTRTLTEYSGTYENRAAQLAIQLLQNGYVVVLQNTHIIDMVRSNSYIPENDRWIKYYDEGHCYLDWNGYQKVLCNRALMTIHNARWNNDFKKVVIPFQSAAQIVEYANNNHFYIEEKVKKILKNIK